MGPCAAICTTCRASGSASSHQPELAKHPLFDPTDRACRTLHAQLFLVAKDVATDAHLRAALEGSTKRPFKAEPAAAGF